MKSDLVHMYEVEFKHEARSLQRSMTPLTDDLVRERLNIPRPRGIVLRLIERVFGK